MSTTSESLGAKFIDTGVSAEGTGGYARELTDEEKRKQQEILDARIALADAVISTASVPGRAAPRIISKAVVEDQVGNFNVFDFKNIALDKGLKKDAFLFVPPDGVKVVHVD